MSSKATYRIVEDSLQERFFNSRAKVRLFGGGFANGKTSASCMLALQLAKEYPGSNGLIARSTYPKLNDTIRKEFIKWCPTDWVKSFPKGQHGSNTCTLINDSMINFRYIAQQGKSTGEATTSNQLSATYDWIIVDQMEDPEIVEKDFLDLLGRLRGMARYTGDDPTMPASGPRWMVLTCNPTRNWIYKKLVHPLHVYNKTGRRMDELMWDDDNDCPFIELFEGSTYENASNLEPDFIRGLEAAYKGQMLDRFLLGKWAAYEGLVYPHWDDTVTMIDHEEMFAWFLDQRKFLRADEINEGYDYGLAKPACHLFSFVDVDGNVNIMDGFYKAEMHIADQAKEITDTRRRYLHGKTPERGIYADPSIFKRSPGGAKVVGKTVATMFADEGIRMQRGNNNIMNGVTKVGSYMVPSVNNRNPYTGDYPAARLYVSSKLDWWSDECNGYYWKKDPHGESTEEPVDKNDHAMDTTKYLLSDMPTVPAVAEPKPLAADMVKNMWFVNDDAEPRKNSWRYANA